MKKNVNSIRNFVRVSTTEFTTSETNRYDFDINDVNSNVNGAYDAAEVNLLYWSVFVVVAVYAIDVIAVVDAVGDVAVGADAAVDLPLYSSSMGLNFERISFSLFAK